MTTQGQPATVTVFSPAKINLYLRIVGRRPDGFHDLETVMVPLDFGDQIILENRPAGLTLECDNPTLPTDGTNLALRAAQLVAETFGVKRGVKISLQKRTPLAAGLGGGSSNAAAVLLGLNRLWHLNASPSRLGDLAAQMGSDINFFLAGSTALCRGRGEQVEPVPSRFSATILLVNPGFGISTKWAYASWAKSLGGTASSRSAVLCEGLRPRTAATEGLPTRPPQETCGRVECGVGDPHTTQAGQRTPGACPEPVEGTASLPTAGSQRPAPALTPVAPDVTLLLRALAADDLAGVSRCLFNSLEAPSLRKFPVLELLKDALRAGGASGAMMSGSGATVFGLFANREQAEQTAASIRAEFGPSLWTQVAALRSNGVME